jgi:hypothetical protein
MLGVVVPGTVLSCSSLGTTTARPVRDDRARKNEAPRIESREKLNTRLSELRRSRRPCDIGLKLNERRAETGRKNLAPAPAPVHSPPPVTTANGGIMAAAIVLDVIAWDGANAFPNGIDDLENKSTATYTEFVAELDGMLNAGAQVLATLPLARPGQALVLVQRVELLD